MDFIIRDKLEKKLHEYITDTLEYTETVKDFVDRRQRWTEERKSEVDRMTDIKAEAEKKDIWSRLRQDSRREELENKLGEVLKNTLEGLEKLQLFLDAVEKLAVTSLFVFIGESFMLTGVNLMSICMVISAARFVSPRLVHFKRKAEDFFLPSLCNVQVLIFQLDKYISVTQEICEKMENSFKNVSGSIKIPECINGKLSLEFMEMTDESVKDLYEHLLQLIQIRMDESFRMTFLFGEKAQNFIQIFSERHCRMFEFLSELEEAAVQLDKMKMGSNISTVAGSSVGIAGGVLSIVGLALAPVTAGTSLALTITGVGLGVTSGVNSITTGITEMAVNSHHGKSANNIFTNFMEDVQKILECLEEVASVEGPKATPDVLTTAVELGKLATRVGTIGKSIDAIVDAASAVKALRSEAVVAKAVSVGLQEASAGRNIPKLAADLPDIGQLAKGTPLALSQSARAGFIGLNALFIGLDVLFICKDGISLAKGSKNEFAQLIRSRSVLWISEVQAWEKIHNHLFEEISGFKKKQEILEKPFC